MHGIFGPPDSDSVLGYCTNVHPGQSLDEIKSQLEMHAATVKRRVSPRQPMGIGLWFPASVAQHLVDTETWILYLRQWLEEQGLLPFTINGFPFGDFHAKTVKHDVYQPNWTTFDRVQYTLNLALILHMLLPDGATGSISTLPIGWKDDAHDDWADQVEAVAEFLAELRAQSGRLIHIDFEPEPGCVMETSEDVVRCYESLLASVESEDHVRQHVRICHDICHAAVMFEDQKTMFDNYRGAGLSIGKVQISNAIRADFRNRSTSERIQIMSDLRQFSEDRYLHQTMISSGNEFHFFEDLPTALAARGRPADAGDEWRIHFHVPVYLEQFGVLKTTRDHIVECFKLLKGSDVEHWEVETYAWNVLPPPLQVPQLSEGIAKELQWVLDTVANLNINPSAR